jgi:hypothetical protein
MWLFVVVVVVATSCRRISYLSKVFFSCRRWRRRGGGFLLSVWVASSLELLVGA